MIFKIPVPAFYSRGGMNYEDVSRARLMAGLPQKYREQYIPGWEWEPVARVLSHRFVA